MEVVEVLLQVVLPVVLPVVQLGILVILGASKVLVNLSVLLQAVLLVNYRFLPCPEKSVSPMFQSVVTPDVLQSQLVWLLLASVPKALSKLAVESMLALY